MCGVDLHVLDIVYLYLQSVANCMDRSSISISISMTHMSSMRLLMFMTGGEELEMKVFFGSQCTFTQIGRRKGLTCVMAFALVT